jgi:glycosyltransferase involved in cell wall biosynthesis
MRVCMVGYTFYEVDNRVMRYSEALLSRGDAVDVLALRRKGQPRVSSYRGVRVLRIQKRRRDESKGRLAYLGRLALFLIRSACVLTWRHLRNPYDVVHVHSVPDFEVLCASVARLFGAKVILDIHDIVPEFYCSKFGVAKGSWVFRLLVAVERLSIAMSDHVIVANDIWRDRLLSRSVAPAKCTTIMNYPDPRIFYHRPRTRRDRRFVLLYPGTINYHQGVDIAVRAFSLFAVVAPNAEFHIYGDGPDREALGALVLDLQLQNRVFLHDAVPLASVAGLMAEADVGVIPKRSDSFGDEAFSTKSLEFMSLGVPVIVSATTVDRRYFDDSVVCFFEPGNERDLAEKLLDLYKRPDKRNDLSESAGRFVAGYRWDVRKEEYFDILRSLIR